MGIVTHLHGHAPAPIHPLAHCKIVFAYENLGSRGTPLHGIDGASSVAHDGLELAGGGEETADTVLGAGGEDGAVGVPGDRGDGFFGGFDALVGDAGGAGGEGEGGARRGGGGGGRQEIPEPDKPIGRASGQEVDVFRVPRDVGDDVSVFCPHADFICSLGVFAVNVFIFLFGAGIRSTGLVGRSCTGRLGAWYLECLFPVLLFRRLVVVFCITHPGPFTSFLFFPRFCVGGAGGRGLARGRRRGRGGGPVGGGRG